MYVRTESNEKRRLEALRTPEARENNRLAHLGKKYRTMSKQGRNNISEALKGRVVWNKGLSKETDKRLQHLSQSLVGKKQSEEHKRNNSLGNKGKPKPGVSLALRGRKRPDISKANKGRVRPQQERDRIRDSMIEGIRSGRIKVPFFDTFPERKVEGWLKDLGELYVKQYSVKGVGVVDFFLPERNMIIEVDGDYWHKLPGVPEKDNVKTCKLRDLGYSVLRLWESEVYGYRPISKTLRLLSLAISGSEAR